MRFYQYIRGGLGILSGDHLKSSSDLGIPLVGVGLLYKQGYFLQKIDRYGHQQTEYNPIDIENLPIVPVKKENGEDLIISIKLPKRKLYIKVWKIDVGRVTLYLLDTDINENHDEYKGITLRLYGGDQETRIQQEMVLGIGRSNIIKRTWNKPYNISYE
jgi:starch phosphorylase